MREKPAQRRTPGRHRDGDALFDAILATPTGITFSVDDWPDVWNYVRRPDRRFTLAIPELLAELAQLDQQPAERPHERAATSALRAPAAALRW